MLYLEFMTHPGLAVPASATLLEEKGKGSERWLEASNQITTINYKKGKREKDRKTENPRKPGMVSGDFSF